MAKGPGIGERACPKCKETIRVDASICKHCKTEFSAEEVAAAKAEGRKSTKYAAFGCLGVVLLLGFCTYAIGSGGKSAQSVPEKPGPTAKADVIAFYRQVANIIRPCDAAGAAVAEAGKSGDAVVLYQAAGAMENACVSTGIDVGQVEVPASVGKELHAKLTETLEVCNNAYVQRWSAGGKMKEALDSHSVSSLAALKETTSLVQAGQLVCATGLVGPAMELGATQKDLGLSEGK